MNGPSTVAQCASDGNRLHRFDAEYLRICGSTFGAGSPWQRSAGAIPWGVTSSELALLQASLAELADPVAFTSVLYRKIFERQPSYRALFAADLGPQLQQMASAIQFGILHIEDDAKLMPALSQIAHRHVEAGITSQMFEVVGLALQDALREQLGDKFSDPLPRLWASAYQKLSWSLQDRMWHAPHDGLPQMDRAMREKLLLSSYDDLPSVSMGSPKKEDCVVQFVGADKVTARQGDTLLQVARTHGIPMLGECGGHGRCTTCRVFVEEGIERVGPRTAAEEAIAQRRHLPPKVRLACQTQVLGPCRVRRLLHDERDIAAVLRRRSGISGQQREVAVLFADIRDFTPFVEQNLAHDVTHMLNRYFTAIVDAMEPHGAYVDKYIGDGIMVLFGLDSQRRVNPCLDAVQAALAIQRAVTEQNPYFEKYFGHRFVCGVGVHFGPAVIGDIGSWRKSQLTALGDTVNVASRIESATKHLGQSVLISEQVVRALRSLPADLIEARSFVVGDPIETVLKGKSQPQRVYPVRSA